MKRLNEVFILLSLAGLIFMSCSDDSSSEPGNKSPTCVITSPADGSLVFDGPVIVNVDAEDDDGNIFQVRLSINGIGYSSDNEYPYSFTIPVDSLSMTTNTMQAVAEDNDGAEKSSSEILIIKAMAITFPDLNLDQAVRTFISKPTGSIYIQNVEELTSFDADSENITDIYGMEYFTGLEQLILNNNFISNLSPLSNLTNLTRLELYMNNIYDISALSNLTNLAHLHLLSNHISNLDSLSNLNNLVELILDDNNISDISALSNMTSLESLNLARNAISEISLLSNFTNLSQLHLYNNQIVDISSLTNLVNLAAVNLDNNQIVDIYPLVLNTGLSTGDYLYLRGNPLSSISINTYIPQLEARGVWVEY